MPGHQSSAFKHEAKFSAPETPDISSSSSFSELSLCGFIQGSGNCQEASQLARVLSDCKKPQLQPEFYNLLASLVARSTDYAHVVLECPGMLEALLTIATSPNRSAAEPAIITLAHLAGLEQAKTPINAGQILSLLLKLININRTPQFLRQLSGALHILCCRSKLESSPQLFHALHQLLHHFDQEVVERACWALAAITRRNPSAVQQAVQGSLVPQLCELLGRPAQRAAVQALAHIAASDCQALVACGTLPSFHQLLTSPHTPPEVLKDTIHILEEICTSQLQAVIDSGLVEPILDLVDKANSACSMASAQTLYSLSQVCSPDQVMYLVSAGVVPTLCHALHRLPLPALLTLHTLLQTLSGEERKAMCQLVEELGAVDSVEALQHHSDLKVYRAAHDLLAAHFPCTTASPAFLDECGNHPSPSTCLQ